MLFTKTKENKTKQFSTNLIPNDLLKLFWTENETRMAAITIYKGSPKYCNKERTKNISSFRRKLIFFVYRWCNYVANTKEFRN